MNIYIALILPDLGSYKRLLVELQRNGQFVQFLVCAPAILTLTRRYHRLVTGTIQLRVKSLRPSPFSGQTLYFSHLYKIPFSTKKFP